MSTADSSIVRLNQADELPTDSQRSSFMDDLLVLAPSRPRLRKAVKRLHGLFDGLHLRMHPDKTFVGRWDKGFEFLGLRMEPAVETGVAPVCQPDAMNPAVRTDPLVREPQTLGEVLETPPSYQVEGANGSRTGPMEGDAISPPLATRPIRLTPAQASWSRFVARYRRFYEQEAPLERLDEYVGRWVGWFGAD